MSNAGSRDAPPGSYVANHPAEALACAPVRPEPMRRRDVLKRAALAGVAVPLGSAVDIQEMPAGHEDPLAEGAHVRQAWVARLTRVAEPVLSHLAAGTLKRSMPVEGGPDRQAVTHLEALGRTLAGLAPWINLPADAT